jgi:hypothetical protein
VAQILLSCESLNYVITSRPIEVDDLSSTNISGSFIGACITIKWTICSGTGQSTLLPSTSEILAIQYYFSEPIPYDSE